MSTTAALWFMSDVCWQYMIYICIHMYNRYLMCLCDCARSLTCHRTSLSWKNMTRMQVTHFPTGQRTSLKTMASSKKVLVTSGQYWPEFPENGTGISLKFAFEVLLDFNAPVPQVVRLNGLKGTHLRIAADFQALSSPWYEKTQKAASHADKSDSNDSLWTFWLPTASCYQKSSQEE